MPHNHNASIAAPLLQRWQGMQTMKRSSLLRLMEASNEIIARRHENLKTNSLRLIESAKPRIATIENERHETASYFNVFSALGVIRKEVIQSRFLAYLLSPNEHHDQSIIFLEAFLQKLNLQMDDMDRARVVAERSGTEHGRMDIVIDCEPWLIVIEIKIDAGEGAEQLQHYRTWLDKQPDYDNEKKHLIFLTPNGHESITGAAGAYQTLSYSDVANAFSPLLEKQAALPPSIREVLQQYISICRLIGEEDMTTQDKELQALITNPDNLRAALEMEQQTALARKQIAKTFTSNVTNLLKMRIAAIPEISLKWKANDKCEQNGRSFISIQTSRHSNNNKNTHNYVCYAEYLFALEQGGKFGWWRPIGADMKQPPQETTPLSEKMVGNGCTGGAEYWWLATSGLRGGDGGYILTNNDDILTCHEDNQNSEHPLATKIADELWAMFTTYRADIEALPSFQQAATQ